MFTCQVHELYTRAEEQEEEEEVQIYFLSTKTIVNIKKRNPILSVVQHASHDNEHTLRLTIGYTYHAFADQTRQLYVGYISILI